MRNLGTRLRQSVFIKVLALGALVLLLCIPLEQIRSLISDRLENRNTAAEELASTYVGQQVINGPFLVQPYTERWTEVERDSKGKSTGRTTAREKSYNAVLLPDSLKVEGSVQPEQRYRSIYSSTFYKLASTMSVQFGPVEPQKPSMPGGVLTAGAPILRLLVSDVRGIDGLPTASINGEAMKFEAGPGAMSDGSAGVHAVLGKQARNAMATGGSLSAKIDLNLTGMTTLSFIPVAESNDVTLQSPWPDPAFGGSFLPVERTVTAAGFNAHWAVTSLVSSARSQLDAVWGSVNFDDYGKQAVACGRMDDDCTATVRSRASRSMDEVQRFSVTFVEPTNVYFMAHRAAKYGAFLIGLVVMATFMFEILRKIRLHPVQYGLVGMSIALFFLLLVALSEKLNFGLAYAISAAGSVSLLAVYFGAVLQSGARGVGLASLVAVLYGVLYGLIASESNSLLLGALLVFGMLSLLMLATRKVNWYALSGDSDGQLAPTGRSAAASQTP